MAKKKSNKDKKQPWSNSLESREALYKGVNPSADFDPLSIATQTVGYLGGFRTGQGMPEDEARWAAYLGLPYDKTYAPDTKIRFEGDENYPDRQYQGLSKRAKDEVRKKIIPQAKRIKDKYNKEWIQVLDTKPDSEYNDATIYHSRQNYLGDLGKFGIREVGESGIYEVGDKYDFPALIPIPNRNEGTELMVRDTIWSDRANPKLYNQEVIKRNNKHSIGGLLGKLGDWNTNVTNNMFTNSSTGQTTGFGKFAKGFGINSGNIGGIANTAATAIGGLAAGGRSTRVGNAMQKIGSLASNIPGVGGIIGAGVNLLGGVVNGAFGSKLNAENIAAVEGDIKQALNFTSNAGDYDALASNYAGLQGVMGFNKDFIGKDGWIGGSKAKRKFNSLKEQAEEAEAHQLLALTNNAQNIANTNLQLLEANYNAYGGPIHIKPDKRGTFTAAAKKRGMGVQEFASKVLANKEDYSPSMVKKANFARNASKWKHADGGPLEENNSIYRPYIRSVKAPSFLEDTFNTDINRASKGTFQDVLSDSTNTAADFISKWYTGRKESGKFDEELKFVEDRAKIPTFIIGSTKGSGAADYVGTPKSNVINVNPTVTQTNWGEDGIHRGDYVSRLVHEMAHASSMYRKTPDSKAIENHEASPTLKKLQSYMGDDFNMFPVFEGDTENAAEYYPRLMQMREAMNANPLRTDYTEKELDPWLKKFGLPTGERGVWMMNNLVDASNNNLGRSRRINNNNFTNESFIAAEGGPLDTKAKLLKRLEEKRNRKGTYGGGKHGGAGAGSLFLESPDDFTLVKDTILVPYRETFNDAFGRARAAGLDEFMFDNKAYTTELGDNPDNNRAGEERAIEGLLPVERTRQVKNKKAEGGQLFTNGVTTIGNGGTHESNPYEGVQMGVDPQGIPNLVEEGEVIYDDYVFSNRLRVPKAVRQKYKLRGITFADAAKQLQKESEERPNDPISKNGLNAAMAMLQQEQEAVRMKKESNKYAKGGKLCNKFLLGGEPIIDNPYSPYRNNKDDYSRWFTLDPKNTSKVDSYSDPYKNLIFTADMARAYAKNNPNDESLKSFLSRGNKLENLTDEDVQKGSLDTNFGWLHKARASAAKQLDYIDESKLPSSADVDRTIRGLFGEPILNRNNTKVKDIPIVIEDEVVGEEPLPTAGKGVAPMKTHWLRYAPIVGAGLAVANDLFGGNEPDYSNANMFERAIEGTNRPVRARQIGNYLTYRPFDRDYYINKLNADTAAGRRAVVNTSGGNRAAAMAGILASDYNYGNQLGALARQAEEYNLAQRQAVEQFNRGTNVTNAEMAMKADLSNAEQAMQRARMYGSLAEYRDAIRAKNRAEKSANLTNFIQSLGNLGTELTDKDKLRWLAELGVLKYDASGKYTGDKETKKANVGRINRKKRGGFTI